MVHKTWDGGKDQNCSQDYKTFPLLTTSKSVIINDSHGAKKTCISVIGDHHGFDLDRRQIFETVSSPASSPILITIRREYMTGYAKINQLDSHAGYAWCGLRVDLEAAPAAPRHQPQQDQQVGPGRRRHAPSTRLLDARAAARATKEAEAEEASAVKKAAEEASITRVTEAVIAVGTGVAATAKKNNEASKRAAEEAANKRAATKKAAEEAARKRAHVEAEETANLAEEAERNKEQDCHNSNLNATAAVEEVCMSTRLTDDPNALCEALATYRIHHGNVRFLISDPLGKCMNCPVSSHFDPASQVHKTALDLHELFAIEQGAL